MQDVLIVASAVCCCISLSAVCADLHVPKCSSLQTWREPLSELESLVSIKFALEVVNHVLADSFQCTLRALITAVFQSRVFYLVIVSILLFYYCM